MVAGRRAGWLWPRSVCGWRPHTCSIPAPLQAAAIHVASPLPLVEATAPDFCRALATAHGFGSRTLAPSPIIGRVHNRGPFDAAWRVYLTAARPLPARLAVWAGPGEPVLSVESFDPRRDVTVLQQRIAADGVTNAAPLLASPSVTRLEVRINDPGQSSVFRINLGGRSDGAWAQARVDPQEPGRASVCAGAQEALVPDSLTLRAGVYLGPGGDWYFGSGWHQPDPAPAGFHRRMAGDEASLLLPIDQPAAIILRLSVHASNGESRLALNLNGRSLPQQALAEGWNDLSWSTNPADWQAGLNDLSMHTERPAGTIGTPGTKGPLRFRSIVLDWAGAK